MNSPMQIHCTCNKKRAIQTPDDNWKATWQEKQRETERENLKQLGLLASDRQCNRGA